MKTHTPLTSTVDDLHKRHTSKKVDYAIFSALPEEQEFIQIYFSKYRYEKVKIEESEFKVYTYENKKILLALTGIGTTFAASIITYIHYHFRPDSLLFTGTAGGINPQLKLRDVIIVEKAFEAEIQGVFKLVKDTPWESCLKHPLRNENFPPIYSANEELFAIAKNIKSTDNKIYSGNVVTSNAFPAPPELFEKIKSENPYSIDMETSAFYQVAWALKAKALAIRGISNILNQDGTDDKIHESDVKGSADAAAKVLLNVIDRLLLTTTLQSKESSIGYNKPLYSRL